MIAKPVLRTAGLAAILSIAGFGLAGCSQKPGDTQLASNASSSGGSSVTNPCTVNAPSEKPALPPTIQSNQLAMDCAAWQTFITLNWQADPNDPGNPDPNATWASFGTPGNTSATVWESYLDAATVFSAATQAAAWSAPRPTTLTLSQTSKFGDIDLSSIFQAGAGDHWLTNQRGDLTFYQILINQDEFAFIKQPGFDLTTAAGQLACATQPGKPVSDGPPDPGGPKRGGFNMPAGNQVNGWDDTDCAGNIVKFGQGVGAIEIKAAWTPLPADHSLDYRYKTALARIQDPKTKAMRDVTVGLVGLHIIRKTPGQLPWIWATFEQIDNTPDEAPNNGFSAPSFPANANQQPSPGYTFFNPSCTPAKDPTYQCRHNAPPRACGKGGICMPFDAPMQITRIRPVDATANSVTAYAWSLMPPKSVFNYYRLIDVQYPSKDPSPPPGPGLRVPLTQGRPVPAGAAGGPQQIVANTTLESFQQTSASCMDCHANFASIAQQKQLQATAPGQLRQVTKLTGAAAPYASDYSFVFLAETTK